MPLEPLQTHKDTQPGEIVEEFFLSEVPDPKVPLDQNAGETIKLVMVKLYAGEFSHPARRASVADKDAHPEMWAAFEEKVKAAGEELPDIPKPDNTLPVPDGELEKPPPGTDPPLGGGSLAGSGHPSGQPVRPEVEPHRDTEKHKR